ncbi:MAG: efflux RND transporter permease subunit, partial [Acholeplasmataceae bacterium]|nr:efflux RND transporter permease subunit [Acholeplasmataceae bacterium]
IPISVIAAFMLMYFTNVTLNLVSMGGLALGIGMLVDNSIVVIENIYRMIGEGKSKKEAAIEGSKQVAGAITSSTLTTAAVFLPIVFIEGMIADVFISMALTIAYSLGASLVIALTLVPAMASRMLDDTRAQNEGKVMYTLKSWYKSSVLFTIKNKALTLVTVIVLLLGSVWLVTAKGFIMLPTSDEGVIDITISTTTQTLFADKAEFADQLSNQLMAIEDIEIVSTSIGGSGMMGRFGRMMGGARSDGSITFTINLEKNRSESTQFYESYILDLINNFDFSGINMQATQILETTVSAQNSTGALGGAQGVNIKVSGYDLETLEIIANDITAILDNTPGVIKADSGISYSADNVKITVDRTNAMTYGLTNQAVMDNVNYLFANLSALGASQSLTVEIEGISYVLDLPSDSFAGGINFDVFGDYKNFLGGILLFDASTRQMIDSYMESSKQSIYVLNAMLPGYVVGTPIRFVINPYLKVTAGSIVMNPMSVDPTLASLSLAPLFDETANSVAVVDYSPGFATIRTDGSTRFVTVTAQVEQGKNVTLVSRTVNERVNAYLSSNEFTQHGNGYNVTFQGENEDILQAVSDLIIAAIVAILLVYMVMAIQFQSLVYPFIILFTIPLAFTGGMLALLITNQFLSLVSIMGLIILIGVVVNNGIVLIDYINKLRESGKTVKEAIIEAGQTRLRPIFMTALTTILALFTMAIGFGEGSELLQPMAITAIGGLIYATILTLVVVPTIYAMLNRKRMKREAEEHAVN